MVQATDEAGKTLPLVEGPSLPEWAGVGDPALGYYAGLPGMAYARVLQEVWTEVAPSGAYWNPTRVLSDNRLAAFATDSTQYVFDASLSSGSLSVEARLLFRRAFIELMDQKGWDVPDALMEESALLVPQSAPGHYNESCPKIGAGRPLIGFTPSPKVAVLEIPHS